MKVVMCDVCGKQMGREEAAVASAWSGFGDLCEEHLAPVKDTFVRHQQEREEMRARHRLEVDALRPGARADGGEDA